jgi:hypothetical protein
MQRQLWDLKNSLASLLLIAALVFKIKRHCDSPTCLGFVLEVVNAMVMFPFLQ